MNRQRILTSVCALAVVAAGLTVAMARPEWLPPWARLGTPNVPVAVADDAGLFCAEHGVPETFCTLCHEELKAKLLLCKEHGDIPEDICTLCHPEVEKKHKIEMCPQGHGLPKHFCVECGTAPSASLNRPDDGWCAAHGTPEALCRACLEAGSAGQPLSISATGTAAACRDPLPLVRLASAGLARKIGLTTAEATEEEHAHRLVANAEVAYDANHFADVTPRVSGFLREVKADLGQDVRPGDVLCVIDSSEVSAAKARYLASHSAWTLARASAERTRSLARTSAVSAQAELEALTTLNRARADRMDAEQALTNLGLCDAGLAQILDAQDTKSLLEVVAPIDGTVVLRHAVRGEAVQATTQLFAVADTSRMWLWIDVYEADIQTVKPGQPVSFAISGTGPDEGGAAKGHVNWVGTEVNPQTRTTRVRAELANPEGRLRANQFGQAEIQVGDAHKAVIVPKAAVQRKDNVDVVFLPETEEGVYRPQRVVARPTNRGDVVEVAWGLQAGQRVVTKGAFLLKTEIMKGSIGAGCCE